MFHFLGHPVCNIYIIRRERRFDKSVFSANWSALQHRCLRFLPPSADREQRHNIVLINGEFFYFAEQILERAQINNDNDDDRHWRKKKEKHPHVGSRLCKANRLLGKSACRPQNASFLDLHSSPRGPSSSLSAILPPPPPTCARLGCLCSVSCLSVATFFSFRLSAARVPTIASRPLTRTRNPLSLSGNGQRAAARRAPRPRPCECVCVCVFRRALTLSSMFDFFKWSIYYLFRPGSRLYARIEEQCDIFWITVHSSFNLFCELAGREKKKRDKWGSWCFL